MKNLTLSLTYNDHKTVNLPVGKMTFFDEFYVDCTLENVDKSVYGVNGQRLKLIFHPKQDFTIQSLDIQGDVNYLSDDKIFCNGFQSWSESREYRPGERIGRLRRIGRPLKYWMGDEFFDFVRRERGWLHSWSYTYVRSQGRFNFFGSLAEQAAFTVFQHETAGDKLHIQPDCAGLTPAHSFPLVDLIFLEGDENKCFDAYFALAEIKKPTAKPAIGWTSWYHYYTDISQAIIEKNLAAWQEKEAEKPVFATDFRPEQIFQIDDGWQTAVGDWLSVTDKFPQGMSPLAAQIKAAGYVPGLWLAPFICDTRSDIFKNHKDWLLKDGKGKPLRIGYSPLWKGGFYALDFYHGDVRNYLTQVFQTVLLKWGYEMLKLDFLYAVCLQNRPGKTRGQIMHEAMTFIRQIVGDKLILGCGVPLASAFGLVDYCRIGADIHLKWEHKLLAFLRDRERVSTIVSLRTTLGRYQLNGRAFHNDPDVFLLRKEKNKLTPTQQDTILKINALLGNLVFTSDYLADYDAEQTQEFFQLEMLMDKTLHGVEQLENDLYKITFTRDGKRFAAWCNLAEQAQNFQSKGGAVRIEAFETLILRR